MMKRTLSLLLCFVLLCGVLSVGATALEADDAWRQYYAQYAEDK